MVSGLAKQREDARQRREAPCLKVEQRAAALARRETPRASTPRARARTPEPGRKRPCKETPAAFVTHTTTNPGVIVSEGLPRSVYHEDRDTERRRDVVGPSDRPAGFGRNTGRGFDFASLRLRPGRRKHPGGRLNLDTTAKVFNVLNHADLQLPNNTLNPANPATLASFGRATAADSPRRIQFGLRLNL